MIVYDLENIVRLIFLYFSEPENFLTLFFKQKCYSCYPVKLIISTWNFIED